MQGDSFCIVTDEIPLEVGESTFVRVGDTVRCPPEPPGVQALLNWYAREDSRGHAEIVGHSRRRLEQREWRGVVPRDVIVANFDWATHHAPKLSTFLV